MLIVCVSPILSSKAADDSLSKTSSEQSTVVKSLAESASDLIEVRAPSVYLPKDEIDFSNICNKPKLETIKSWYEGWLGEFYLHKPFANMLVTSTSLVSEISSHVATVQKYLADLQAFLARTDAYALYFTRAKMYGLVHIYSIDLGINYNLNGKLGADVSLQSSKFNEFIANTAFDREGITKASETFYKDLQIAYGKEELQATLDIHASLKGAVAGYMAEIKLINQDMCGVLMNTVGLFAGEERMTTVWTNLQKTPDKINSLAFFFKQFQYSVSEFRPEVCGDGKLPGSIRAAISLAFVGQDFDARLKTTFFSDKLFESLQKTSGFTDVLEYDALLLVPKKNYPDLFAIQAIKERRFGLNVDFLNEFPSIDATIVLDPKPENQQAAHTANTYLLLYRLYVLLRSGRFGIIKIGMSATEIYLAIYNWVISTNYFKIDVVGTSAIEDIKMTYAELTGQKSSEIAASSAAQDLILVSEYILYYSPLITLLATKSGIKIEERKKDVAKNIEDLPIVIDLPSVNFPKDSVHPEVVRLVGDNLQKAKLGAFSKSIRTLKYDETLKACTKPVKSGQAQILRLSLTYDCAKPFYEEWVKLFTLYFGKLGDNEDITPYVNVVETSVQSLDSKDKQDLLNFCIVMYFQLVSQRPADKVKSFERRAAERFLMKAITLMTAGIGVNDVKGFTTFMIGASDYHVFGKYFKFIDSAESEFHGFNIFYIVLFAQVNEAKRLNALKKPKEAAEVMSYKAELQRVFELRYPNVVKIMSDDARKRPLRFIKSIFKTQFFLNFLDFFDMFYYRRPGSVERANPVLQSEFISIHTVFINFYHFLYSLRNLVNGRIESPYIFVLERLQECMVYASRSSTAQPNPELETICTFSDRKYAELYYFYKFYLILSGKADLPLTNFSEEMLNTHMRMFFIYAINSGRFSQELENRCKSEKDRWNDLCISWVLFRDFHSLILDSTHRGSSFSFVRQFITEKVLPNPNALSVKHVKFNVLFAAEAISLLVDGKGVNYSRFIALFNLDDQYALVKPDQRTVSGEDEKVLALFKVTPGDALNRDLMVQYLKRTYFKKGRTSNEQAMTLAVSSVIDESSGPTDGVLRSFFTFGDHVIVNYVKLFLMYSTRDEHYSKIADFLIANNVFFELANLNRPEDDMAYRSMLEKTALQDPNYVQEKKTGKATSEHPHNIAMYRKVLFKSLAKRYKKMVETAAVKLRAMAQVDQKQNVEKSADEFDIFGEFLEMGKQDVEKSVTVEEKQFDKLNEAIRVDIKDWSNNPTMKEIKIWASQKDEEVKSTRTSSSSGITREAWVMTAGDSKAMLQRAEQMEDQLIAQEKIDPQNFGFSEKSIISDHVNRIAIRFKVNGNYVETGMKTNTIMESLLAFKDNVETAKEFIALNQDDLRSLAVEELNQAEVTVTKTSVGGSDQVGRRRAVRRLVRGPVANMQRVRI